MVEWLTGAVLEWGGSFKRLKREAVDPPLHHIKNNDLWGGVGGWDVRGGVMGWVWFH